MSIVWISASFYPTRYKNRPAVLDAAGENRYTHYGYLRAAVPDKEREASAELADDFGMDEQMSPLAGRQNIEFTNRQLVSLILPMLAEQLLGITVGLADSLMVATVGDASISACLLYTSDAADE